MKYAAFVAGSAICLSACGLHDFSGGSEISSEPFSFREPLCEQRLDVPFFLDTKSKGYNPSIAHWGVWLAQTVESQEEEMQARLAQIPIQESHFVRRDRLGLQAGVFRIADAIVIAFRGTADDQDVIRDALVETVSGASAGLPGRVHEGFRDNFLDLWSEIYQESMRMGAGKLGVWLFAHSMGGALSAFSAYNFAVRRVPVYGVYTSGTPLPGDGEFQKKYNAILGGKTFVLAFDRDITPNVPPVVEATESFVDVVAQELRGPIQEMVSRLDFHQVGSSFHLEKDGTLRPIANLAEHQNDYFRAMRVENPKTFLPYLLGVNKRYVSDHDAENYRCAMRAHLKRL